MLEADEPTHRGDDRLPPRTGTTGGAGETVKGAADARADESPRPFEHRERGVYTGTTPGEIGECPVADDEDRHRREHAGDSSAGPI